jgi:hypothetical protein
MGMLKAQKATCSDDLHVDVLCCSCCGKCGDHLHDECGTNGDCMKSPSVATCADDGNRGVLCCASCGNCGEHLHSEC